MPYVTRCSVVGCNSNSDELDGTFGFHTFPNKIKKEHIFKSWVVATNQPPEWKPNKVSVICSKHFRPEEINLTSQKHRRVVKDSIPTIACNLTPQVDLDNLTRKHSFELDSTVVLSSSPKRSRLDEPSTSETFRTEHDKPVRKDAHLKGEERHTSKDVYLQVNIKPDQHSVKIQTKLPLKFNAGSQTPLKIYKEVGIQTDFAVILPRYSTPCNSDFNSDSEWAEPDLSDFSYRPSASISVIDESINEQSFEMLSERPDKTRKFIVNESCILKLLKLCFVCLSICSLEIKVRGTLIRVIAKCQKSTCGKKFMWQNEENSTNKRIEGHLLLSAAILYTGSCAKKVIRLLKSIGINTCSYRTYFRIQSCYLFPSIEKFWEKEQARMFGIHQGKAITVAADGRCDSPGNSAKYGSYTMLDSQENKVLHVELIQSNEVGGSSYMEKEGLIRSLNFFEKHQVRISHLITDRHAQIRAYLKSSHPEIVHLFDVWHIAKGFNSKLNALAKKKKFSILGDWSKSISNHIYWLAASSKGDQELMASKWKSMLRHVCDIHEGHEEPFLRCEHGALTGKKRKWLEESSDAFKELEKKTMKLVKDIRQLSSIEQTASAEVYHSVINHFAPKSTHYSLRAMNSRLVLAALHFNENSNKSQAQTAEGEKRYKIVFPKAKAGTHSLKKIKVESTFEYVEHLMAELFSELETFSSYSEARSKNGSKFVECLASQYERPSMEEAINSFQSRYAKPN